MPLKKSTETSRTGPLPNLFKPTASQRDFTVIERQISRARTDVLRACNRELSELRKNAESARELKETLQVEIAAKAKTLEYEIAERDKEAAEVESLEAKLAELRSGSKLSKYFDQKGKYDSLTATVKQETKKLINMFETNLSVQVTTEQVEHQITFELVVTHVHPLYSSDEYLIKLQSDVSTGSLVFTDVSFDPEVSGSSEMRSALLESQNLRKMFENVTDAWRAEANNPLTPRAGKKQ